LYIEKNTEREMNEFQQREISRKEDAKRAEDAKDYKKAVSNARKDFLKRFQHQSLHQESLRH